MNELGNTPADKNYKPSGISRAEERALEFYPMKDYNKEPNYIHSCDSKMLDEIYRQVFMLGYEQAEKDLADIAALSSGIDGFYYGRGYQQGKNDAEKDLALTWEDMRKIIRIDEEMMDDPEAHPEWMEEQPFYEEMLRRFKEAKK